MSKVSLPKAMLQQQEHLKQ